MAGGNDDVYAAIGEVLTDADLEWLVRQATGEDIYNIYCHPTDPRKIKIKKTIEALLEQGNERWLLTWVLIHVAAQNKLYNKLDGLNRKVVNKFPKTLVGLPEAGTHLGNTLLNLQKVLSTPFPTALRFKLKAKRVSFSEIAQKILVLFAYKSLQEGLLALQFTFSYNESLLADPDDDLVPNYGSISRKLDDFIEQAPAALSLLGTAAHEHSWIGDLAPLSSALRAAAGSHNAAAK